MKLNNFSDFTRVAIIDDNAQEGEAIRKALLTKGIASAFFDVSSTSTQPNGPYKNIRLVFLDLELLGCSAASGIGSRASVALAKLSKVVDTYGCYVLVIWSNNTTKPIAKEFKKQLHRTKKVAKPIKEILLDKADCQNINGTFNISKINYLINSKLSDIPAFTVFSEGERIFQNASGSIIAGLISKKRDNDSLSKIINSLSKIGEKPNKKANIPNKALANVSDLLKSSIIREVDKHNFGNLSSKLGASELNEEDSARLNYTLIFSPNKEKGSGAIYFTKMKNKKIIREIFNSFNNNQLQTLSAYRFMKTFYVDVTPLCGSAQENGHQYFLEGVLHPMYKEICNGKELKVDQNYCYMLKDKFLYKKKIFRISFNIKSYTTNNSLVDSLGIYEKLYPHIVIDIQHKIASYISRPGHALL